MKEKKLQVFVSSTFTDLKEERQAAVEAILSAGHIPAGMELFTAGDESQMTVIKRWIDESDVYLLILGGRYGSVEAKTGKSYTHLEYEYAIEKKKPHFAVVVTDKALDAKISAIGREALEQEHPKELKEFKTTVLSGKVVKFWDDYKDIKLAIHETLSEFMYSKDLIGWIRGDNAVNTGALAEEIARLTKENSELRNQISNSNSRSEPLYAGLTYTQLSGLLRANIVKVEHDEFDLLQAIEFYGQRISLGTHGYTIEERDMFNKLANFKLLRTELNSNRGMKFYFTDEGHNFYLRILLTAEKEFTIEKQQN
ncbi:DUF4062 domain-containing protein [Pontibacter burrus]|uniref:DUF4062 domain-containing protein n=1 Tax=Pontibacter burrus TaxID=2704466 RepID=A0A6B3LN51_9BACT|nr:DUF4062 domain-containing protein [Pontibacter burrus]NEM98199.1 DUF4062 domain-containing protein [Pontibacter burrus]